MSPYLYYQDKDKRMDIFDIISRSLLHDLDAEEQQQLDQWLAESKEHQQLYQSFLDRDDLVGQYHSYMSLDEKEAWQKFALLIGQTENTAQQSRRRFRISRQYIGRVAAIVVGVMLVAGGYWYYHRQPVQTTPVPVSQELAVAIQQAEQSTSNEATLQVGSGKPSKVTSVSALLKTMAQQNVDEEVLGTLTTRHDKEFWMTLSDGSRVHLNGNSRISYPLAFTGNQREVALVGEAYFIVAKDPKHPFIVHTAKGDVKEYGTEFNVNTQGDKTCVVLVKGSISVRAKGGKEQMMAPGDKADIAAQGVTMSRVDVEPYVAWNTGHFSFEDCKLDDLMQVVAKWYGLQVSFTSNNLRTVRFTGSLSKYESIANTLEVIGTIANVKIEQQDARIIIY